MRGGVCEGDDLEDDDRVSTSYTLQHHHPNPALTTHTHLKELVDLDGVALVEVQHVQQAVHVADPLLGGNQRVDVLAPVYVYMD